MAIAANSLDDMVREKYRDPDVFESYECAKKEWLSGPITEHSYREPGKFKVSFHSYSKL
jgi:hypothetical protein